MPPTNLPSAIAALLPQGAVGAQWEGDDAPGIFAEEHGAVEGAVPKRALEFARGRACARAALASLGVAPGPLPTGRSRAPIWPSGIVGSITHCVGFIAAIAAPNRSVRALGVDAEPAGVLPPETRRMILHPGEATMLEGSHEKVVFCAKESVFKALHPLTGIWFGFQDVVVDLDAPAGRFSLRAAPGAKDVPMVDAVQGRYTLDAGFVVALSFLPRA